MVEKFLFKVLQSKPWLDISENIAENNEKIQCGDWQRGRCNESHFLKNKSWFLQ